jgi:hypothetical protein
MNNLCYSCVLKEFARGTYMHHVTTDERITENYSEQGIFNLLMAYWLSMAVWTRYWRITKLKQGLRQK